MACLSLFQGAGTAVVEPRESGGPVARTVLGLGDDNLGDPGRHENLVGIVPIATARPYWALSSRSSANCLQPSKQMSAVAPGWHGRAFARLCCWTQIGRYGTQCISPAAFLVMPQGSVLGMSRPPREGGRPPPVD